MCQTVLPTRLERKFTVHRNNVQEFFSVRLSAASVRERSLDSRVVLALGDLGLQVHRAPIKDTSMTIEDQLRQDQTAAMKARDKDTLNAIRSVQAEVAIAKSAPGFTGDVDDELYVRTIATYVKRVGKSQVEYDAMGDDGAEQAAKLAFEIDYLGKYLPKVLDEAATRVLVDKAIVDLNATPDTPAGQIIGTVMRSGKDLDGTLVNRLVQERQTTND
jgi:uncharacterized protein YqeY